MKIISMSENITAATVKTMRNLSTLDYDFNVVVNDDSVSVVLNDAGQFFYDNKRRPLANRLCVKISSRGNNKSIINFLTEERAKVWLEAMSPLVTRGEIVQDGSLWSIQHVRLDYAFEKELVK